MVDKELFTAIIETYGREVYTFEELRNILLGSGFSPIETKHIIREAINGGYIGRVKFRKLRRNFPKKNSFLVLSVNKRNQNYGKSRIQNTRY